MTNSRDLQKEKDSMGETCSSLHIYPSSVVGKALATNPEHTTDVSHKLSGCFTSRVGFFLTVIHAIPSAAQAMTGPRVKLHAKICEF